MSKNNIMGNRESENTKHTSSARVKYSFNLLVEESRDGILMPQQKITMSGDVEVTEVRKFVRAAVKGALEGVGDHFGLDDEPDQDPTEDPLPDENPEPEE